ncbi:MAG: glutaminyl-peptide cyclotransferase [Bacteroidia bacterium]|nr:MAG: glutaminyl-peptide cyclotransferase [Bacteroidia bacterium]
MILPFFISLLFTVSLSCCSGGGNTERTPVPTPNQSRISTLVAPAGELTLPLGTEIDIQFTLPDTVVLDSVQAFLGGALKQTLTEFPRLQEEGVVAFSLPTEAANTGKSGLRIRLFFAGGVSENQSRQLTFLSDVAPVEYSYQVVREYPHDPAAYTQGLQFDEGTLYEGTGNYGTSSIRRVKLETGEVTKIRDLEQSLFGEGITVMGQRIYQLTYKSQVGFIYDKSSFEEIQKVYYQNREGWGLTHNGEELIMSDGTNVLYFLDPEMFTVNRQIEVYDHKGPANSLNELEYIRGKIWANRYYTDEIVIIDPETGKVEGRINLKGILKTADRKPNTDVLNGVAWDSQGNRIFVTGKFWPKLFEIRIRESG